MKAILLTCIVILFTSRIEETPSMLSEKRYYEKVREIVKNNEDFLNNLSYEKRLFVEKFAKFVTYPYSLVMILIYAAIGKSIGLPIINFLSFIQICTVVITMRLQRNVNPISLYIDDFPFYKWYFLFNVVLDYVYYPLTFVMLLMSY
ncbi:hypothetical protein [Lacrimispora indolis]|uniref:hypothetical protein n=1 Tax=Lacrimispora indolis TaxID=69825 RepID=UPI000462AFEE|nr:hypothetical protein [[Clostridium] methoxybenzovorans]